MIIGFAKHQSKDQSASTQCAEHYLALTDFMDKPNVLKQINGQLQRVERTPIPEVLAGSAPELCRQIAALPFQSKYCFGMLSFAAEEVDVAAFNAGDPTSRFMVNQALVVLREAIWPAIPVAARPMLYVTAHTHTGHLELNFALPKMVYNATGKIRSYDPDPPKGVGYPPKIWSATRDFLNQQFGWADPKNPYRARHITCPDWVLKLEAEAACAGLTPDYDPRADLTECVLDAISLGELVTAQDIRNFLQAQLKPRGWMILSEGPDWIAVGLPDAAYRDRYRLKGPVFAPDFVAAEHMDVARLLTRYLERKVDWGQSLERFAVAYASRAVFNLTRYGQDRWPNPDLSFVEWQDAKHPRTA